MALPFINTIDTCLSKAFGNAAQDIFDKSLLIQYIANKTKSANRGSKSRSSFGNLYALYVVIEDYLNNGYDSRTDYDQYEGAKFSNLFARQREMPFGAKLQNHSLNNRMNAEFQKFFPTCEYTPIIRDLSTNRYRINEHLLKVSVNGEEHNLAKVIIEIINQYIETKQSSFGRFIEQCKALQSISGDDSSKAKSFILELLAPTTDARLFEIVSFAILKSYYSQQSIFWGENRDSIKEEVLSLFKTGRTNANDGGIDFVMKPLGRFFQVTETLDFKKYFLDIEKIERFPITFVVKSTDNDADLRNRIEADAKKHYGVNTIVKKYMECIEEIINIPFLTDAFNELCKQDKLAGVLQEIIVQSKVEFNYEENQDTHEDEENDISDDSSHGELF